MSSLTSLTEFLIRKTVVVAATLEQVRQLQKQLTVLPQTEPRSLYEWLKEPCRNEVVLYIDGAVSKDGKITLDVEGLPKSVFFIPDNVFFINEDGSFTETRDMTGTKWGKHPMQLEKQ